MSGMDYTIQLNSQGEVTLPVDLCEKYQLQPGQILHLVDLGGFFALVPFEPQVHALAQEIENLRIESGIPMDDLLQNLDTLRHSPQS